MLFKTDWTKHLHATRRKEVEKAMAFFGSRKFHSGLEVGSGDGFQTSLIAPLCDTFISTDLNFNRIVMRLPNVTYLQADADHFENLFAPESFDLIFSSSFLEHIQDPRGFLKNSSVYLTPRGYAVHIVPNRWMKVAYLGMFYPNFLLLVVDRIWGKLLGQKIFHGTPGTSENNINRIAPDQSGIWTKFKKLCVPSIHGMYRSHTEEFYRWGKGVWRELFISSGYHIVKEIGTSAHSGYGFGLGRVRQLFERMGITSLTIFILQKNG